MCVSRSHHAAAAEASDGVAAHRLVRQPSASSPRLASAVASSSAELASSPAKPKPKRKYRPTRAETAPKNCGPKVITALLRDVPAGSPPSAVATPAVVVPAVAAPAACAAAGAAAGAGPAGPSHGCGKCRPCLLRAKGGVCGNCGPCLANEKAAKTGGENPAAPVKKREVCYETICEEQHSPYANMKVRKKEYTNALVTLTPTLTLTLIPTLTPTLTLAGRDGQRA